MKKLMALVLAAAMLLAAVPTIALAAYEPSYTAERLRAMGETVFTSPDSQNTSVADAPVSNYWEGWTTDNTYGTANYKYYGQFGDYVVQFYRDEKSTNLTTEQSFFPNAQNGAGLAKLIAPAGGFGAGTDFVLLDYNFKIGNTTTCYMDYYFKDIDGKVIAAVRYDVNGMAVATNGGNIVNIGSHLEKSETANQPFSFAAWNNGEKYTVSLEKNGSCIFTADYEGSFNGFGSIEVVSGNYNWDFTHTAIGGLKITAGILGEVTAERALESIRLPYNIKEGSLPKIIFGKEIVWTGADFGKTAYTTITAEIDGITREFEVMIMGKNDNFVAAYTTKGNRADEKSMHLAVSTENGWQELNFGIGVLFAKANLNDGTAAGTTRVLDAPYLYRTENGKIGVAAKTMNWGGAADSSLTLWETDNLVNFAEVGTAETVEGYENSGNIDVSGIDGNVTGLLEISDEEADYLKKKLSEVKNTDVEKVNVRTAVGVKAELPETFTANYTDGSTEEIPVIWNKEQYDRIDFSKAGVYTVEGQAQVSDYDSPMIWNRADPVVYNYNGKYYFIATTENSGNRDLYIRCSDTIEGLADAEEVKIFAAPDSGDMAYCNWAPELHEIGGKLCCLFAAATDGGWNSVQSRIMECSGDPMDAGSWSKPVRVTKADGSALIDEGITLDMTYFEAAGKHYYVWAQRPITAMGNGNSMLYIAEIDPENPQKLMSEPVELLSPQYAWDRQDATVDEGPNVLKSNGKLYLSFSGDSVSDYYCLSWLTADENGDLLNPDAWEETGYPVLASAHVATEYGPGHNFFTKDKYGRDVIILHMKPNHGTRSMTARTIHYAFDGTPILYMTADRFLKEEYRNVTATITVRNDGMSDEEFEVNSIVNNLFLNNTDNVKEHLPLVFEKDGAVITWESNSSAIASDGVVTRGETDQKVTLTATAAKNGVSASKTFNLTVKAKAAQEEKVGYIYAYFRGSVNGEQEVQAIHIAISDDGLNWRDLNGNFPIITSTMGTKGLRDPYIIRSYEGDKFYLMATDLDSNGGAWGEYGNNGSQYLMFWESEDLINWSEQRMIKVSDDRMGCTWAPEAIYDDENHEYLIYWASSRADLGQKVIQCARTRDFRTFSEPEIFMGTEYPSVIDTSMIKGDDGKYYRFTKDEAPIKVFMEVADTLHGEYTRVDSTIDNIYGVEGPGIFRMNDGKFCLMLDGYAGGAPRTGFFPLVTDDIASGQFELLTEGFKMPTGAKHGTMVPITQKEYDAVMEKWGPLPSDEAGSAPAYEYKFENDGKDSVGTLHGNAKIENGVLTLDGRSGSYFSLPTGILDRRDTFTVSMDVLSETTDTFFFTFGIGNDTSDYFFFRTRPNDIRTAMTISGNSYEEGFTKATESPVLNTWHNYTIVAKPNQISVYVDGVLFEKAETTKTLYHLGENLQFNLGKSVFSGDAYFKGKYDNVMVFNRALTADEIKSNAGNINLLQRDADALEFVRPSEITYDLDLPTVGANSGAKITWTSSDTSVIRTDGKINRDDKNHRVDLTAVLELDGQTIKKEFKLTVLAEEKDSAYLFAYFTGNNADQERLFYGVSKDGYNFRALNGGNSVLTSDLGTGCIRDPFIFRGEDGYYYILATDMKSSLGWSSNYAIVVYKTPDLINIVDKEWINYRNFPSSYDCTRAWAPQAIWCPEKNAYMIYITMELPHDEHPTVMYRNYATDLCNADTYTDVEFMLGRPENINSAIDGDIIYDKFHDEYIMFYNGKQIASSKTLSGTWNHVQTKYDDGQIPMVMSNGVSMAVEGSNIWQIIGEDKWVIAADGTSFNGGCYAVVETTDFENYTQLWESEGDYSFDFTPRHGYVIPVSERELENLFTEYGDVELPGAETEKEASQLTVDLASKGVDIQKDMYGIFFEDINYAADGGMYSEAVENRSFEAVHCNPDRGEAYTKIPGSGWTTENAKAQYLSENPLNENNTTYVRLTAEKDGGLLNEGFGGFAVHKGEKFNASLFVRGDYDGSVTVSIMDGNKVLGSTVLSGVTGEFTKLGGVIKTNGTASEATVKVTLDKAGTVDMDMISVMSQSTYNGRNNGLRKDIVEKLAALHPGFIRFPGGCVVEGYYLNNRYSWKDSVGSVEERKENWNRWQTGANAYDYCQTLGMGFYEYFLLCEDIGAKPLPVVGVGIGCQYQSGEVSSWEDLYDIYIPDAIDLIEFANGDPETSEWAKVRADMGHPEPFNLEYIGIGNEQWNTAQNRFFERYEAFEEEIHKLYPDIKLISTSGPSSDGVDFDNAWNWLKTHNGEEDFTYAVDEHYYRTPEWFLSNVNRYDSYDRDGFAVFAGEYAANGTYGNTLWAAIAEAAYMTGLEKNADIVKLASYAPLLAKIGMNQWAPDMIWFNNTDVYGSPDYWVQLMYANNNGSYVLDSQMKTQDSISLNGAGVGTWATAASFKDIFVTDSETGERTELKLRSGNVKVTASYEPETENSAVNLIDTDKSTRWSTDKNGSYAVLDLGENTYVSKVGVSFMAKAGRRYYYTLQTSADGVNYVTVFDGASKVNSAKESTVDVNEEIRYIKLISGGNSETSSNWFSPTELTAYGEDGKAIIANSGTWSREGDVISQSDTGILGAFNTAPVDSKNYTLELKAMKTGGAEGFLIPFNYEGSDNCAFWNIGGWGNTASAVQSVADGNKVTYMSAATVIENNVWYDIKVEVEGTKVRCYLNGQLVNTAETARSRGPVYTSSSYDEESGDVIIKLVNTDEGQRTVSVNLENGGYIAPEAKAYVLTGASKSAANTVDNPDYVKTEEVIVSGISESFEYTLDALSFVVMRIHTKENYAVSAENVKVSDTDKLPATVEVTLADGSTAQAEVEWRIPKANPFVFEGTYTVEGKVKGTDLYTYAELEVKGEYTIDLGENNTFVFKASAPAKAIVAVYKDGELVSAKTEEFSGTLELQAELNDGEYAKAMLWDEDMKALCEAVICK